MYIFIEPLDERCRVPKTTSISVANLLKNSNYIEKYIKVAWCLYPHVPEKTEKLYGKFSNRHSNDIRYFEITKHVNCRGLCLTSARGNYFNYTYNALMKSFKIIRSLPGHG